MENLTILELGALKTSMNQFKMDKNSSCAMGTCCCRKMWRQIVSAGSEMAQKSSWTAGPQVDTRRTKQISTLSNP